MAVRALIYRRFSTDEQESGAGNTLARQLSRCQKLAAERGWTVAPADIRTDKGRSAYKGEHLLPDAELGKIVADIAANRIEPGTVIIAERLDRLSRLPVDQTMAWIHGINSAGIQIALADTGELFSANPDLGTFIGAAVRAGVAHEESRKKADLKVRSLHELAKSADARTSKWVNLAAKIPTWLERNETRDGWVIVDSRADIVRDIYQMAAGGLGAVSIAQRLNDRLVPSFHKGEKWGRTAVRQILMSPTVEGDYIPKSGELKGRVFHGFFPRIVPADIVAQARSQTRSRRKVAGAGAKTGHTNLFAGLMYCDECERRGSLTTQTQKGRKYRYIVCEAAREGRCENRSGFAYAAFENTALDVLLDLALDDRFFAASDELRAHRERKAEIEKQIADKRSARSRLLTLFEGGDDQVAGRIGELREQIATLLVDAEAAEQAIMRASGKVSAVEHLKRVGDIREAAQSEDHVVRAEARAKLRQAMATIVGDVHFGYADNGTKIFTIVLLGGIMGIRIDTEGKLLGTISHAIGRPLSSFLTPDRQAALAPLIARIERMTS